MLARLILILALVMQSLTAQPSCANMPAAPISSPPRIAHQHSCCCGDSCTMSEAAAKANMAAPCVCNESGGQAPAPSPSKFNERGGQPALLSTPSALLALAMCDVSPSALADRPMAAPALSRHVIHCIWMI